MSKSCRKDLTGQRFGNWTVLEFAPSEDYTHSKWLCQCDCGNKRLVSMQHLIEGRSKSCRECSLKRPLKHGESKTRLYRIWSGIKRRCLKTTNPRYSDYGGRGITICDEWKDNFIAFRDWAMSHGYADDLSIDRIDNDGNYEPNNCRWADDKTQARNRRKNPVIEYSGKKITLLEAAKITGIAYDSLRRRYCRGDRGERLLRPIRNKN